MSKLPRFKLFFLIFVAVMIFSGCGGTPTTNPIPRILLTSLSFPDKALAACVQRVIAKGEARYVDEMKVFECSHFGKPLLDDFEYGTGSAVHSLEGLNSLTALEELDLSDNWIAEVDLKSLAHLKILNLYGNIIQTLDLSRNGNLQALDVGCNPLAQFILPSQLRELYVAGLIAGTEYSNLDGGTAHSAFNGYGTYLFGPGCDNFELITKRSEAQCVLSQDGIAPLRFTDRINGGLLDNRAYAQADKGLWLDIHAQPFLQKFISRGLDLSHLNLSDLAANNTLQELTLTGGNLTQVAVGNYLQLQTLNLSDNRLIGMDTRANTRLRKLNIANNAFTSPSSLQINEGMEELDLSGNNITLPLLPMASLKKLGFSGDLLAEDVNRLNHLEEIDLVGGSLAGYPLLMPNLKTFSAINTHIDVVDFSGMPNLEKVILYRTGLQSIELHGADQLTSLDIDGAKLAAADFSPATKLTNLRLNFMPLLRDATTWPIGLQQLELSSINWSEFDARGLPNLRDLNINYMPVAQLDLRGFLNLDSLLLDSLALKDLDLSPVANMNGSLTLMNCPLVDVKAVGLQNVSQVYFSNLNLNETSKNTLTQLTGVAAF